MRALIREIFMLQRCFNSNITIDRAPDSCLWKDGSLHLMYLRGQKETDSQKEKKGMQSAGNLQPLHCKTNERGIYNQWGSNLPWFLIIAIAQIDMSV